MLQEGRGGFRKGRGSQGQAQGLLPQDSQAQLTVEEARLKLHEWYKDVNACTIREVKSAKDCIKSKEQEVLNFFINRSTNASAESLNSKMKGFRA